MKNGIRPKTSKIIDNRQTLKDTVRLHIRCRRTRVRYLILSDIHSNLEAFEKCLEIVKGRYDQVLCLGDLVGYGPDPNAIVDAIQGIAAVIIRGNHDKACCGITDASDFNPLARASAVWTREQLTPRNLAVLQKLPPGPVEVAGCELVHGSPCDEDEYLVEAFEALPAFEAATLPVVFFGHTHLQGGFMIGVDGTLQTLFWDAVDDGRPLTLKLEPGARYLINPGSVGQPRDRDPRAAFAILHSDTREVDYYRASYDIPATQKKMKDARLPEPLIIRLQYGR
jgi:predicted phosphodiesterase